MEEKTLFSPIVDSYSKSFSIKDESKILSRPLNDQGGVDFVLKHKTGISGNNTKLSEVFDFLPYGRINKTETGIGATTLELKSERNSIIVQPLKFTASEKAEIHDGVFYFGDLNTGRVRTRTKFHLLEEYLNNDSIIYKKISVVADSLPALVKKIGIEVFHDYFLLIDEIDCIQKDSVFRNKMEICIEIYKKFNIKKRAVISATLLSFSDPKLSEIEVSPLTTIKYPKHNKGKIDVFKCDLPKDTAFKLIGNWCTNPSNAGLKIVIAYNSVSGCLQIADTLVEKLNINKNEISIICGKSTINKNKIQSYDNKIADNKFPCRINFTTSAFFNGFDIDESYDLIIISESDYQPTRLSEHTMVQIAGRCRTTLNSFTVLYDIILGPDKFKIYDKDSLIGAAKTEISSLHCLEKHYTSNPLLYNKVQQMRKLVMDNSGLEGYNFVKSVDIEVVDGKTLKDQPEISYLNIDAFLEDNRVALTLYKEHGELEKIFISQGYTVIQHTDSSQNLINKPSNKVKPKEIFNAFVEEIAKLDESDLKRRLKFEKDKSKIELYEFILFGLKSGITKKSLFKALESLNNINKVPGLNVALSYFLEKKRGLVTERLISHTVTSIFKLKHAYTPEEIIDGYKAINLIMPTYINQGLKKNDDVSVKKAKTFLSNFIQFKNTTKKTNTITQTCYKAYSYNPYNFKLSKQKKD
jgi:hypothetical protein